MAVETADDRAAFFDTDDFGVIASWNHVGTLAEVDGILSSAGDELAGMGRVGAVGGQSRFLCTTASLPSGAAQGDTLQIGNDEFLVRELLPSGTGMTAAVLEKRG